MGREAEHVYTKAADIARFNALIEELPANARVILTLRQGGRCEGVVAARPTVQVFRDEASNEGINALLTLEHPDMAGWTRDVWMDQILQVEHVDSTLGSES
jgi:hypothetical protein